MKLNWQKKQLKLKETFSISYGNYDFRNALLITISHQDFQGYGECVEINYYGIHLDKFVEKLDEIQPKIEEQDIIHPRDFFDFLLQFELNSFLLSALDCAYWDLYGKIENKSFAELNNIDNQKIPVSTFTISIAEIEEQIQKIQQSEWNRFKVKCNSFNFESIQKLLETGKQIALDANTSFSDEGCKFLQNQEISKQLLYVEQPKPIGDFKILNKNLNVNWMADEDFQNLEYLEKLRPHYNSINIKLMKCGGLTPALEIIQKAKKFNFQIMIGCMTESSVGISAGIAIAPICDFVDLDGANLISNDYAEGSFVENGKVFISEKPGLGISLK